MTPACNEVETCYQPNDAMLRLKGHYGVARQIGGTGIAICDARFDLSVRSEESDLIR